MTVSVVVPSVTKTSFFSALSYLWHCREPNEGHREPHRRKRWRYVITFAVTVPLTVFSTSASTRYKKKYLILSPTLACHLCSHPSNCQYVNRMSKNSPGCRDPRHPRKRIDLRHAFTDHTLNIEYTEKMSRSRILSCHPCFQRSDSLTTGNAETNSVE